MDALPYCFIEQVIDLVPHRGARKLPFADLWGPWRDLYAKKTNLLLTIRGEDLTLCDSRTEPMSNVPLSAWNPASYAIIWILFRWSFHKSQPSPESVATLKRILRSNRRAVILEDVNAINDDLLSDMFSEISAVSKFEIWPSTIRRCPITVAALLRKPVDQVSSPDSVFDRNFDDILAAIRSGLLRGWQFYGPRSLDSTYADKFMELFEIISERHREGAPPMKLCYPYCLREELKPRVEKWVKHMDCTRSIYPACVGSEYSWEYSP